MNSCLETVFQTGKYQFTSNSFLNLLSEKDVPCSEKTIMITYFKDYVLLLFGLDTSCAEYTHYEY